MFFKINTKKELQETIKQTVQEFFEKMTFPAEIKTFEESEGVFKLNLESETPEILIGEQGQTLADIQRILGLILRRKMASEPAPFFIEIDINNYKKKKKDYLQEMASSVANEVALLRIEKELPVMTAYERRIIHMALANRSDVITESRGEEPERRVAIKPR
jgi:spoIIIJ-associated protein